RILSNTATPPPGWVALPTPASGGRQPTDVRPAPRSARSTFQTTPSACLPPKRRPDEEATFGSNGPTNHGADGDIGGREGGNRSRAQDEQDDGTAFPQIEIDREPGGEVVECLAGPVVELDSALLEGVAEMLNQEGRQQGFFAPRKSGGHGIRGVRHRRGRRRRRRRGERRTRAGAGAAEREAADHSRPPEPRRS